MRVMLTWLVIACSLLVAAALPAVAQETYRFGVTPWQRGQSFDDLRPLYRPLIGYLEQRLGVRLLLVGARSYDEMIDYLAEGKVHVASISPAPYVLARRRNPGIELIATEMSWNDDHSERSDSYEGLIVSLKTRNDLSDLGSLSGKLFGFVTESSTSGFRYPVAAMKRAGIDYKTYFKKVFMMESHPRVTDAVAAGSIDAGATWDFNLKQAVAKHGDVFKVLLRSPPIPNLCIAAHPSLPSELQQRLRDALLAVDPALLDGLPAAGYAMRPDSFYDVVRLTME